MIKRLLLVLLLISSCLLVSPITVYAAKDILGGSGVCSSGSGTSNSAVCTDKGAGSTNNPISQELGKITDIVAFVAGAAAIVLIIIGGIRLIISRGDSNAIASARNTITYALIGLAVIVLARSLITYVVSRL